MGTIEQTCPLLDQFLKDWCGDPRRSNRRPRLTVDEADEDDLERLENLKAARDEVDPSEWDAGVSFIHDDYFEQYARDFAEDIGAIQKETQWPATCIDWGRATNELKMDYTEIEIGGDTYYYRQ